MQGNSPDGDEQKLDEEDEWQLYASAGYASAETVTEVEEIEEIDKEEWFDGDDLEVNGAPIDWDAPPCPAPLGVAHIIKMGTCDYCLHRVAGRRTKNRGAEGGREIREDAHARDPGIAKFGAPELCPLCEDLFDDTSNIVSRVIESTKGIEYGTIQFGIHLPKDLVQDEDKIRSRHGAPASRPLKAAFVDAIQEQLSKHMPDIEFVKEKPDLMILVDGLTLRVDIDVRPVFLYGRYRKLSREIPQTRWPCRACRGRAQGCESCQGTGLQYPDSVQDLIGEPIRAILQAEDTSFHGMGREDIDVRCLGSGRPFVLEIKNPQIRKANLVELVEAVNDNSLEMVEIDQLDWTERKRIGRVKETRSDKSYTIRFRVDDIPEEKKVKEAISGLSGVVLGQDTPKRVSHRRAAKTRKRKIVSISDVIVDGDEVQTTLRCEAGTYIKELIHSDEGRTVPSVSGVLDRECEVLWLDVEEIHAD
ncbi:MAG: tRNA pseudouridine(54/55) synthase Pus10 [Candidatus Thalassarchaeum sp.]|jgi:tRNA pseudouridine synthase 10|nr:tRNA pseudouridine(54/55) synthase Pus10 [Candidatus Thalassarchaeum sp.]HJM23017.1 tRNA pseudouridine(54/55) synthase Pus10 [Candidatus Thalassarchaeum sp.]|tara:strand:+ start:6108 stop:7532 length:1425 start_codon:yes stop_codon:yes gene_type:complete